MRVEVTERIGVVIEGKFTLGRDGRSTTNVLYGLLPGEVNLGDEVEVQLEGGALGTVLTGEVVGLVAEVRRT